MKNQLKKFALLGALTIATVPALTSSADAAPKNQRESKQEVRESRREVKEAKRDLKEARKDLRDDKRDLRREDNGNNRNDRNNWNNRSNNRPIQRTYTGTVTSESRYGFTLRTGNTFLNVSLNGVPQRISRGDLVQVTGVQTGSSFRASSVRILRNR